MTNVIKELEKIDWDFKRYRQTGIDNIHWFPANFIPQIPSILIANLSNSNDTILDPFCGSGTTLTESTRLGRNSIGVDVNPLSCLIAQVKVTYIEPVKLKEVVQRVSNYLDKNGKDFLISDFPNRDKWFHTKTLQELGEILYMIKNENDKKLHNLLLVCFSAILKKCCTQRDHYTYVADNMFPKKDESLIYVNAKEAFFNQLVKAVRALDGFYNQLQIQGPSPEQALSKCKVCRDDARSLRFITDSSIDLIVTSPPYANVTDTTNGNRLSFYWLDLGDLGQYKQEEIGARWKRARKSAIDDYISDMRKCFIQMARVLKPGAYLSCVLGETSSTRKRINLKEEMIRMLTDYMGFDLISKNIQRNIYAKRIRAVRGVDKEHILIFRNVS